MKTLWHWIRRGLLALVLLFIAWHLWLLGNVLWWKWVPPSETSFMSLRLSELNQTKPDAARLAAAASVGNADLAAMMRDPPPPSSE